MEKNKIAISDVKQMLESKSPTDVKNLLVEKINERNVDLNALIEVFDCEATPANDQLGGVPIVIKDNMLLEGYRASAGSKMLENYTSTYTATALERLQRAGAYFIGRANMDDAAMGSSTETSFYGPTKNPLDTTRVPGGSSGGSAASVAAGFVPVALGSDTGGSIRQPAAMCGVIGFKPTYGSISRFGLIALASSLDQIGTFTNTIEDAENVFMIMRGEDENDATTISDEEWVKHDTEELPDKFTVGVPWNEVEREGIDDDVLDNFKASLEDLKERGIKIVDIDLPLMHLSLPVYYIIQPAEASSNLARYDGVKYGFYKAGQGGIDDYFETRAEGFGSEVRRRIILGTYVLSAGYYDAYYGKATKVRQAIIREFQSAFKNVHAIATPTTPSPAFKIGEKISDPLSMYLSDIFTVPANIAYLPSIALPHGQVKREEVMLPTSLQLTASHCKERILFEIGKRLQS
jgi:aspartyl-tRNA(Asn)/glutamyl-tRNA(Gln) amidotransferase subunit A